MKTWLRIVWPLAWVMVLVMGCGKPEEPGDGGEGNGNVVGGHEYVDLGLPSGILWATCNVGASRPEECGDYFAWGETQPKDIYDWKSYQFSEYDGVDFRLTKYCTDSFCGLYGFVDSLTVLEPMDDAVSANWGEGWRTPTKEDYEELTQNATFVWAVQNGVGGRLFTGPNGNSVFFPVTGFFLDDQVICPGLGIYWSSTLHSGFPERGWSLHFDDVNYHVCGTYERCRGQVVRAVCCRQ